MNTGDASEDKKFSEPLSRLKQERELRAWTQSEVAERIGTTQVNVSRWEKGITVPGPYYRQKLGELFSKSIDELGLIPSKAEEVDTSAPPSDQRLPCLQQSGTCHTAAIHFLQVVKTF